MATRALHVWLRRCIGIVLCSLALGPGIVLMGGADSLAHGNPVFSEHNSFVRLAILCVQMIPVGLLILSIYALVMHVMRRFNRDNFVVALLMSVLVIDLLFLVSLVTQPVLPSGWEVVRLLPALPFAAGIGSLYWLLVVRVERRAMHEQCKEARSIAAME